MREQITNGIINANEDHGFGLTEWDINTIAESILAALSIDDTTPTAVDVPAHSALLVSASAVIADAARRSLTGLTDSDPYDEVDTTEVGIYPAGEDYREFRQFLLAVQHIFPVSIRCTRTDDRGPTYLIAGAADQHSAFYVVAQAIRSLAAPSLVDLTDADRARFWATLGNKIVHDYNDAQDAPLSEDLLTATEQARAVLNSQWGRARTLTRVTPAADGPVHALATQIAAEAAPTLTQ